MKTRSVPAHSMIVMLLLVSYVAAYGYQSKVEAYLGRWIGVLPADSPAATAHLVRPGERVITISKDDAFLVVSVNTAGTTQTDRYRLDGADSTSATDRSTVVTKLITANQQLLLKRTRGSRTESSSLAISNGQLVFSSTLELPNAKTQDVVITLVRAEK